MKSTTNVKWADKPRWLRWLVMPFRLIRIWRAMWKYRHIDRNLCCCGAMMNEYKPFDSICAHGGCKSAYDYAMEQELA